MNTDPEHTHGPGSAGLVWEFAIRLCLLTDTHVGAARVTPRHAAESDVDLHLDRDPRTGVPRLRATTLAGLLRHELLARTADPVGAAALLGSSDAGELTGESALTTLPSALDIDDSYATLPEEAGVTVRVGTRVDPATGSVHPGRMWQWEVLPAGTVFHAHLRLRVTALAEEAHLLTLLTLAARGLDDDGPGIRIGARSGRGHGAVRAVRWAARRHDLTDEHGWFAYHASDWSTRWQEGQAALTIPDRQPTGRSSLPPTRTGERSTDHWFPENDLPPDSATRDQVWEDAFRSTDGSAGERSTRVRPGQAWSAGNGRSADQGLESALSEYRAGAELAGILDDLLREHGRVAAAAHLAARAAGVDRRHRAELRMRLHVAERPEPFSAGQPPLPWELRPGLLMIGDTPADDRLAEVDRAHRRRPVVTDTGIGVATVELRPVLGDTALFALFKRVSGRLVRDAAEHLAGEDTGWREWHAHWWGAQPHPGVDDWRPDAPPAPSRVRLRATPALTGGATLTTTRLTVDALFGDAVDGRRFTTDLHCGGSAEVVFDITEPDDAVRGLLALVVRELATVPLDALGAGSGSGNGRLVATRAMLVSHEGDGSEPHEVDLIAALAEPHGRDAEVARGWLPALHRSICAPRPTDDGKLS